VDKYGHFLTRFFQGGLTVASGQDRGWPFPAGGANDRPVAWIVKRKLKDGTPVLRVAWW